MDTNFFTIQSDQHILTILFSNPPANVLNAEALTQLDKIVAQVEADSKDKVVILRTAGRSFCAGADIHEIKRLRTAKEGREFSARGQKIFNRIEGLDKPVIVAIQGACVGGGLELVMACHLRLAATEASFRLPESTLGFIPGFGGTQRLPSLIGLAKGRRNLSSRERPSRLKRPTGSDLSTRWSISRISRPTRSGSPSRSTK